jgi:uncharacterized protein YvpB
MTSRAQRYFESATRNAELSGDTLHSLSSHVSLNSFTQITGAARIGESARLAFRPESLKASPRHPSAKSHPTDTHLPGNLFNTFPGLIETDRVIHVEHSGFHGHVFDLSTDSHWYIANGILTHNCTCAAVYHALQVWTANANPPIDTEPDNDALLLYEQACGYVPGQPNTDQGGVEQHVLGYWLTPGAPFGPSGAARQQLSAFVEIDQRNLDDVKSAILEGGLVYIGFNVPAFFDTNSTVWNVDPQGDNSIIAGHAVVIAGYDDVTQRFKLISWGAIFWMSYAFFSQFVDEVYFLANRDWFEKTGVTPVGQTLAQLEALMLTVKWSGPTHFYRWHRKRHKHLAKKRRMAAAAA